MKSKHVLTIGDDNFEAEVLGSSAPFLLDFSATWCGPCKAIDPVVTAVADENVGTVRVGKIDIDEAPLVARRLGIRAAPTLVVFKDGRESARHVGTCNKAGLLALISR